MRLIDADALDEEMEKEYNELDVEDQDGYSWAWKTVFDAPTIEPKEVEAIRKIKQIINISNCVIQEDVLKYKMICEVIEKLYEVKE